MKFKRVDLIEQVRKAMALRLEYAERRTAEAADKDAHARKVYVAETAEAWAELAHNIQRCLADQVPMSSALVPRRLRNGYTRGHLETFDPSPPSVYSADTADLEILLSLLEAATDEEITTTSLERMGFRTARLFSR